MVLPLRPAGDAGMAGYGERREVLPFLVCDIFGDSDGIFSSTYAGFHVMAS